MPRPQHSQTREHGLIFMLHLQGEVQNIMPAAVAAKFASLQMLWFHSSGLTGSGNDRDAFLLIGKCIHFSLALSSLATTRTKKPLAVSRDLSHMPPSCVPIFPLLKVSSKSGKVAWSSKSPWQEASTRSATWHPSQVWG